MSDSSSKLQDEVSGELYFAVAPKGADYAKPGWTVFKSFLAASTRAEQLNEDRKLQIIRGRKPSPVLEVFAAFPRRSKDVVSKNGKQHLVRGVQLRPISGDDVLVYRMEEKMMRSKRS